MTTFRHEPGILRVLRGLNLSFKMYFCLLKTLWVQMTARVRELADLGRLGTSGWIGRMFFLRSHALDLSASKGQLLTKRA